MPALATRVTGGTPALREPVNARLSAEFLGIPAHAVERCVAQVWVCAEHLGLDVTPAIVERVARERLLAMANSAPPARKSR